MNVEDVKNNDTFVKYCDNVYCCNKNPWSSLDKSCKECKEEYQKLKLELESINEKD